MNYQEPQEPIRKLLRGFFHTLENILITIGVITCSICLLIILLILRAHSVDNYDWNKFYDDYQEPELKAVSNDPIVEVEPPEPVKMPSPMPPDQTMIALQLGDQESQTAYTWIYGERYNTTGYGKAVIDSGYNLKDQIYIMQMLYIEAIRVRFGGAPVYNIWNIHRPPYSIWDPVEPRFGPYSWDWD